jgi:hypothetical protein
VVLASIQANDEGPICKVTLLKGELLEVHQT